MYAILNQNDFVFVGAFNVLLHFLVKSVKRNVIHSVRILRILCWTFLDNIQFVEWKIICNN